MVPEPPVEGGDPERDGTRTVTAAPDGGEPQNLGAAGGAASPARPPGGIDTAALRRAWPDVLGWIFKHKRTTWTLLSEHATVHDYDGTKVVLGISTVGIANTFRHGPHADLVRQALIDVLGVDARVEGVPVPDAPSDATGPPRPGGGSGAAWSVEPSEAPRADGSSPGAGADSGVRAATPAHLVASPAGSASAPAPEAGDGGWASASTGPGSGPSWASDSGTSPSAASPREEAVVAVSPLARAKAEVAAEPTAAARRPFADDSAASADDEDIEAMGDVGRPVIERLLGGRVIDEGP